MKNLDKLSYVVPSYIDILVLFLSRTQNRRIIQVLIVCFRQFMTAVSPRLSAQQWREVVVSFALCFETSLPSNLENELNEFLSDSNKASQDDKALDLSLSKCMVQLLLINTINNSLDSSYAKWSVEDTERLLKCLETCFRFSKAFNDRFELCIKL